MTNYGVGYKKYQHHVIASVLKRILLFIATGCYQQFALPLTGCETKAGPTSAPVVSSTA